MRSDTPIYSSNLFSWNGNTGYSDLTDLMGGSQWPSELAIFDSSCGKHVFAIRSERTKKEMLFVHHHTNFTDPYEYVYVSTENPFIKVCILND